MKFVTRQLTIRTNGNPDLRDLTPDLREILKAAGVRQGSLTVFVVGSTAGITTFEYEPGLVKDVRELYERLVPSGSRYAHDQTWGDANGFSHLRATLTGPSLVIPFETGELKLGTWQQVVLAEFDNRPRQREVVVQIIGE